MNAIERQKLAEQYFLEGYNCSQAVCLTFIDLLNIDKDTLLKLASSFGGGIARMRETCGGVSAIAIVLGILYGYSTPETGIIKQNHYTQVQSVIKKFEEEFKTLKCGDLLGITGHSSPIPSPRTKEFYEVRPCQKIIGKSAYLIQEFIDQNPIR